MNYLDRISEFACDLQFKDIPVKVVDRAKWLLLDSFGVMLAGSSEQRIIQLSQTLEKKGSKGKSLFITNGYRGDAADAAMINATSACAHVLDEGHKYARGHVGTYILPSVLAVAEEVGANFESLLTAIVIGYEIAARFGMACRVHESMHPSGTWGTIGAAAAVARMLKMSQSDIRSTMNVAAPLMLTTSWQAATQGATVRDLYSGQGAANAVMAPRFVQAGFTGCEDDVSHVLGKVISHQFNAQTVHQTLGVEWELLRNYFKIHACCRNFQSGIDAALALIKRHQLKSSDIEKITAHTFSIPVRDNAEINPINVLAAKESFPVSLALTLQHAICDQSVFTAEKIYDSEIKRLANSCTLINDPDLDALMPEKRPTRLTLQLKNGQNVSEYAEVAIGDPSIPLTPQQLDFKFDHLVQSELGASQSDRIKEAVLNMSYETPTHQLTQLLARAK